MGPSQGVPSGKKSVTVMLEAMVMTLAIMYTCGFHIYLLGLFSSIKITQQPPFYIQDNFMNWLYCF